MQSREERRAYFAAYRERNREKLRAYNRQWNRSYKPQLRIEHPLYSTWCGMKARCLNQNNPAYCRYGGRGITVFPEWVNDFSEFESWVLGELGPRPEGMSLDRIDNDGNYEPGNLRWASVIQQSRNRRNVLARDLPAGVAQRGDTFAVILHGFPDAESASRAARAAEAIRTTALNSTSNEERI